MNTKKEKENEDDPFVQIFKMAKQTADLESLNDLKAATELATSKDFFTYERDDNDPQSYKIFINGEFSHDISFNNSIDPDGAVKTYVSIAELAFKRGCAFILEILVDKLAKR